MEEIKILILLSIIFIVIYLVHRKDKKEELEYKKNLAIKIRQSKKREEEYEKKKNILFSNMGDIPVKSFSLESDDLDFDIHVFNKTNKLFILGRIYDFSDIIGLELYDDSNLIRGNSRIISKSNTVNIIGRSVIGGLIGGIGGAIIGGTTSKKNSIVVNNKDIILHNYILIIKINNLENPVIKLELGQDRDTADELDGILTVIEQ